jgi:hypothetical protein
MGEIEEGIGRDAFEEARGSRELQSIPAHVWELDLCRQPAHTAGKEIEALEFRSFFAGFVKRLEAEADAEEGDAAMDGVDEWSAETLLVEGTD